MKAQTQTYIKEQRSHYYALLQLSLLSGLIFNLGAILYTTSALASPIEPIQSSTEIEENNLNLPTLDSPETRKINPTINETTIILSQTHISDTDTASTIVNQPTETTTANALTPPSNTSPDPQNLSKQARDLEVQEIQQSSSQPIIPKLSQNPTPEPPPTNNTINNPLAPSNQWKFDFEPYLFIPFSFQGDIYFGRGRRELFPNRPGTILPNSSINVSVNQSLSDIVDKITNIFGVSGRLQAWKGNFGIIADGLYLTTGLSGSSNGRELTLRDRYKVTIPGINIDTQNELASFSLAGSYRFVNVPLRKVNNPSNPRDYYPAFSLEGYAGARYISITQDVDLDPGPNFSFSGSQLTAMLGGVAKLMLSPNFAFYFRGDTSNLGGGNLKQFYNLLAGIDWKFSGSFALRLAYRFSQIEYVEDGPLGGRNGLNLRARGIQLGISWQF